MTKKKSLAKHKLKGRKPTRVIKLDVTPDQVARALFSCRQAVRSELPEGASETTHGVNCLGGVWLVMRISSVFYRIFACSL